MEREALSEGGGGNFRHLNLDSEKLGAGTETPAAIDQSGTTAKVSRFTERERAVRMEATRRYRFRNAEQVKEQNRNRKALMRIDHDFRELERKIQTAWRERNREHLRKAYRQHYASNREAIKTTSKQRRSTRTPEQIQRDKNYQAEYRAKNKDKAKANNSKWKKTNVEKLKQINRSYLPRRLALNKLRRAADPIQRLKDACRTRVGFILRKAGLPKFNRTFELVGCTPDFFKLHLESNFKSGMNWENYGTWEIDHIRPLAAFDLSVNSEKLAAFHYSNCQPLWKIENRVKNAKF